MDLGLYDCIYNCMCQMWLLDYVVQMFTLLTPWIISMPQSQMPLRLLSWLL